MTTVVKENIQEKTEEFLHNLTLPIHEPQALMRHILDCFGVLKIRLKCADIPLENHLLQIFGHAIRALVDDITDFDPIDEQSAIRYLLDAFPDESKRRDGRAWLPLHWAAATHNCEPQHMQAMVEERPVQLVKGHLHCEPTQIIDALDAAETNKINNKRHSEEIIEYQGLLPLHIICSLRHPNLQNVQLLIKKDPRAMHLPDHRGNLPIHWAAMNNRHAEVMTQLITDYPQGAYEANSKGQLPLLMASYNRYTMMMELLLQENPEAIESIDYHGNNALHHATKAMNYEGIRKLLSISPELNRTRNFQEDLPIHILLATFIPKGQARLQTRQLESLKAILHVNPEVAALPDRNDCLPLHLATFNHASYEVVEFLYQIYPSAALVKDNQGKLAIHYSNTAAIKNLLMKASPPLIRAGLTDNFSRFVNL